MCRATSVSGKPASLHEPTAVRSCLALLEGALEAGAASNPEDAEDQQAKPDYGPVAVIRIYG